MQQQQKSTLQSQGYLQISHRNTDRVTQRRDDSIMITYYYCYHDIILSVCQIYRFQTIILPGMTMYQNTIIQIIVIFLKLLFITMYLLAQYHHCYIVCVNFEIQILYVCSAYCIGNSILIKLFLSLSFITIEICMTNYYDVVPLLFYLFEYIIYQKIINRRNSRIKVC